MSTFEWFLLIVVVIVVPLVVAAVVTLWSIDQANKRKRTNRKDAQIGVKRKASLSPEEVEARKAARANRNEGTIAVTDTTHPAQYDADDRDPSTENLSADLDATPDASDSTDSGSPSTGNSGSDSPSGGDSGGGDSGGGDGGGGDS